MVDGVGAAYTVTSGERFIKDFKIKMNKYNSIYQAELIAIKYAVKWIMDSSFNNVYIYILITRQAHWLFKGISR